MTGKPVHTREATSMSSCVTDAGELDCSTASSFQANNHGLDKSQACGAPLTLRALSIVTFVFMFYSSLLLAIFMTMPFFDYSSLHIPKDVVGLRHLVKYLSTYATDTAPQVILGYMVSFIFMQTFMFPGTVIMSLLAGALFGVARGVPLVVVTATLGSSSCYFLSRSIGRPIVHWLWPQQMKYFTEEVAKRKEGLFNYMLFLRITPVLPNAFVNLASPLVDVPFPTFFFGTLMGLIPGAFVAVKAGLTIGELESLRDLGDLKTGLALCLIGVVSLAPVLTRKREERTKKEA